MKCRAELEERDCRIFCGDGRRRREQALLKVDFWRCGRMLGMSRRKNADAKERCDCDAKRWNFRTRQDVRMSVKEGEEKMLTAIEPRLPDRSDY